MTIEKCYEEIGGNYSEVLNRLMRPALVRKFIGKFLDDGSFETLCREFEAGNREEAFRAAHTLKGVCQNLGLGFLSASASGITESLRPGTPSSPEAEKALMEEVKKDYENTARAIKECLADEV